MEALEGTLLISRTAAIILVIGFCYAYFRLTSHSDFYEQEEYEAPAETPFYNEGAGFKVLLLCSTYLILIVFVTVNYYEILHAKQPDIRNAYAFSFSLSVKSCVYLHPVKQAWKNYDMGRSLECTLGANLRLVPFVGPLLVLISWVLGVPTTLQIDSTVPLCYALGSWLVAFSPANGKTNYLKRFMLIIPWVLMVVAYAIYS